MKKKHRQNRVFFCFFFEEKCYPYPLVLSVLLCAHVCPCMSRVLCLRVEFSSLASQGVGSWLAIDLPAPIALSGMEAAFMDGSSRTQAFDLVLIGDTEVCIRQEKCIVACGNFLRGTRLAVSVSLLVLSITMID